MSPRWAGIVCGVVERRDRGVAAAVAVAGVCVGKCSAAGLRLRYMHPCQTSPSEYTV